MNKIFENILITASPTALALDVTEGNSIAGIITAVVVVIVKECFATYRKNRNAKNSDQ